MRNRRVNSLGHVLPDHDIDDDHPSACGQFPVNECHQTIGEQLKEIWAEINKIKGRLPVENNRTSK